jgi:hypothetical protein
MATVDSGGADTPVTKRSSVCESESHNVSSSSGVQAACKGPTGPMTKYLLNSEENTLGATLARMAALDGLSFNVLAQSRDIKLGLEARGYSISSIPNSHVTVQKKIMEHGDLLRSKVAERLSNILQNKQRVSLTFDEWTSTRNRRYMNINVHLSDKQQPSFYSLGLIRVKGSMPAEKCCELLEKKLKSFGISLTDHVVAICTDGASVMTKVGKLIAPEQQLCYAHGIQLAVLDVLYKKPKASPAAASAASPVSAEPIRHQKSKHKTTCRAIPKLNATTAISASVLQAEVYMF